MFDSKPISRQTSTRRRSGTRLVALGYLVALLASWAWQGATHLARAPEPATELAPEPVPHQGNATAAGSAMPVPLAPPAPAVELTPPVELTRVTPYWGADVAGPVASFEVVVASRTWRAATPSANTPDPVILLHGAPGSSRDWSRLAPLLAQSPDGPRDVHALDLPGSGQSTLRVPDHSIRAHARVVAAWMRARGISAAHVVGWSQGGGAALHFADDASAAHADASAAHADAPAAHADAPAHSLATPRIASLTLLAAIGEQHHESSGSYAFEHARYDLGLLVLGPGLDLVPHFGLLPSRDARVGWLRGFAHSDQRPLGPLMDRLAQRRVPTLIIHGRGDALISLRSAQSAHQRIAGSTLIILDANHFIPFLQADEAARDLARFFASHDTYGPSALDRVQPGIIDRAPLPPERLLARAAAPVRSAVHAAPAWLEVTVLALLAMVAPAAAAALAAMLVLGLDLDYGVAIVGVAVGLVAHALASAAWGRRAAAELASDATPLVEAKGGVARRLRLGLVSRADWARRLDRAPFRDGLAAGLVRSTRATAPATLIALACSSARAGSSLDGAKPARSRAMPLAKAAMGIVVACVIVGVSSVVGAIVVGSLASIAANATLAGLVEASRTPPDATDAGDASAAQGASESLGASAARAPQGSGGVRAGGAVAVGLADAGGTTGVLWPIGFVLMLLGARAAPLVLSRAGRVTVRVALRRVRHHEFWPGIAFYALLVPIHAILAIRHRGILAWTACNPGIDAGGGILGESKGATFARAGAPSLLDPCSPPIAHGASSRAVASDHGVGARDLAHVYDALRAGAGSAIAHAATTHAATTHAATTHAAPPGIWPWAFVAAGQSPAHRAQRVLDLLDAEPALGGFPVILKPDTGFRGFAVRLARTPDHVRAYFHEVTTPVLVQRFHPGPNECSLLWTRRLPGVTPAHPSPLALVGEILTATHKDFQTVVGDGASTLEALIDRDPRARLQRDVFRARHADNLSRVLAPGESLALNVAGNHCQGTIFRDGQFLVTDDLARVVDHLCDTLAASTFDSVRLDIRYADRDALQRGRHFAVVDINGTMGESVNVYDPDRSLPWAVGVLWKHWSRLFALGAWRRETGHAPLTLGGLWALRRFYAGRRGSSLSD
jgi:pimeloyl-ACP methyl ester carboxylesterase